VGDCHYGYVLKIILKLYNNYQLGIQMEIINYLLTTFIALIAVYIAYQQYKVNRDKYKFELYEKRYKVYLGIAELLQYIVSKDDLEFEQIFIFEAKTNEGVFLFGVDINTFLNEIRTRAYDFQLAHHRLSSTRSDNPAVGEEKEKYLKKKTELLLWFNEQRKITAVKFSKYLKLDI
jgi:hypothetical protein